MKLSEGCPGVREELNQLTQMVTRGTSRFTIHDSRFTFWVVGAVLATVYAATLAPSVTLWDAGEFNAAIASLGIPHPPGTPLYILVAHTWAKTLGVLPLAFAVNLLSALATAIACGLLAGLVAKWTRSRLAAIAGGLTAGSMLAVWNNATETEIYALSLLLAVLMVVVGDRAGERDSARHRILLAYLIGLAIPIQISALVAAPAAIFLAASRLDHQSEIRHPPSAIRIVALGGVLLIVMSVALASVPLGIIGVVAVLATALRRGHRLEAVGLVMVAAIGMSATAFMLVRAAHDPYVNQGNPATFATMMDVVWRNQYPLPGMWPRQAPLWIQLVTFVQYADWQIASGLDNSVSASWWRTPFSVGALLVAIAGARWMWRENARGARGLAVLLFMSSLGVVAMLNLRAGPSILDAVLPAGATHEPRERDYFFALAFATAGMWIGAGAVLVARRRLGSWPRAIPAAALGLAALPILLNWRAATRRPDAMIAPTLGEALLLSAPQNAMLLVAGDNDSYTTWYRQSALGERRDVAPVTISLLPATWYRQELARRYRLLDSATVAEWRGEEATLQALVRGAKEQGRPVAAAVTMPNSLRMQLAAGWTLGGLAYLADAEVTPRLDLVDSAATRRVADLISTRIRGPIEPRDPATAYVVRILRCPEQALRLGSTGPEASPEGQLDSRCNFK